MPDTRVIPPRVPLVDVRTGNISREWYNFLASLSGVTNITSASIDGLNTSIEGITGETVTLEENVLILNTEVLALKDEVIIYPLLLMGA